MFDKNDPYVEVSFGTSTKTTSVIDGAGKTAGYADLRYQFPTDRQSVERGVVRITVKDHNKHNAHTEIGSCEIPIALLLGKESRYVVVSHDIFESSDVEVGGMAATKMNGSDAPLLSPVIAGPGQ